MKENIYAIVSHKYVVIGILLVTFILSFITAAFPFFAGLGIALITLWSSNWKWNDFGLHRTHWGQTVMQAIAYAIILFIAVDFVTTPVLELFFGKINYENFERLRGNLTTTLVFILTMWIVAAIGEEFIFRGYFLKQTSKLFGNTNQAWILGAVISSLIFGLAHQYQGISGMIQTGIIGLAMCYIFYYNQKNLTLLMLVHGFYNTIGIFLIYFNSERIITDYILNL